MQETVGRHYEYARYQWLEFKINASPIVPLFWRGSSPRHQCAMSLRMCFFCMGRLQWRPFAVCVRYFSELGSLPRNVLCDFCNILSSCPHRRQDTPFECGSRLTCRLCVLAGQLSEGSPRTSDSHAHFRKAFTVSGKEVR